MEFQFGDWLVSPEANLVSNGDAKTQLEPRVMAVLRYLCRHPGAVIPAEEILQACWGSNELGDNPVHKAITQLRRAFGDSSTEPRYIETIRKRGYRAIAPVITLAGPAPTTWEGGSPFRGLEAFQENHAAIFFGRVQATAQLRELVLTQAAHGCPMALVLGPSGSGKTSLVRAGLLPQLMAGAIRSDEPVGLFSTVYLDCADLGSGTLFQALAGALIDAEINGQPLFPGASADSLGQRLAEDPDAVAAELRERACPRASVGVFVDRLEAVFRAQPGEADRFMEVIDALAKSNCLLMLMACRNDFYPEVMAQPVLLALKSRGGHFDVLPPDGADIAQMVRQPAIAASLAFEKDETTGASLDDVLCDAARGNPDMLPLLQYSLNELYRQRSDDGTLRFEIYRQLGGIEGAVGVRAEQMVSSFSQSEIAALPRVLSLLVNVGEDNSAVTSRRSPLSMLNSEDEKELVRVMIEARLFVSELSGDVPSFGVAHEALLRRWPRAEEWIAQHRQTLQLRTRLASEASQWQHRGRPRDLLIPIGTRVTQATDLLNERAIALAPVEEEYIRASESRAKVGERIRFAVFAVIAILAVAATLLGLIARIAQRQAEQHRAEAEALMGYMLGDFAEKLRPIGRLDLLDGISSRALTYLTSVESLSETPTGLSQRAKALQVLAEVNNTRGKLEEAHDALLAARKILQLRDLKGPADAALLKDLGENAFWLQQYHADRGDREAAIEKSRDYVRYAERLAILAPNSPDSWIEQSYAFIALGSNQFQLGLVEQAAEAFERSIALKRRALEAQPKNTKLVADLANSLSWLAKARIAQGDLTSTMQLSMEEQALINAVQQSSPNDAFWGYRAANALWNQGSLERALGRNSEALTHLKKAETIMQLATKQDASNKKWWLNLRFIQAEMLSMEAEKATPAIERKLEDLTKELEQQVLAEPENVRLMSLLAYANQMVATTHLQQKNILSARSILTNEVARQRPILDANVKDPVRAETVASLLLALADVERVDGNEPLARIACNDARKIILPFAEKSSDFKVVVPYFRSEICLGDSSKAEVQRLKLRKMAYQDTRYARYLDNKPSKGNP